MKRNDTGDFCILYVEPTDERTSLFNTIVGQKKPVVIMLAEQAQVLQRPNDFIALKHVKRQLDVPILFVSRSEQLAQLASRNGFPIYPSMDSLVSTVTTGNRSTRYRTQNLVRSVPTPGLPTPPAASSTLSAMNSSADPFDVLDVPNTSQTAITEDILPDIQDLPTTPFQRRQRSRLEPLNKSARRFDEPDIQDISPDALHLQSSRDTQRVPGATGTIGPSGVSIPRRTIPLTRTDFAEHDTLPPPRLQSQGTRTTRRLSAAQLQAQSPSVGHEHDRGKPYHYDRRSQPVSQVPQAGHATNPTASVPIRPVPASPPLPDRSRPNRFLLVVTLLTLLALTGAGVASLLVLLNKPPMATAPVKVGHISFLSTGQINENSSQGIDDKVQIDLNGVDTPQAPKSYYAWLLSDTHALNMTAILLGALSIEKGQAHLLYSGDTKHTNLLEITSRFLVTEEDATVTPLSPSPDTGTWRYYGEFPQPAADTTDSTKTPRLQGYLDHLRSLLAADPVLDQQELPGGLSNWLYRNTGKLIEWTVSARDHREEGSDYSFIRYQTVRILAYLDGLSYVQQDLPAETPVTNILDVNARNARIGILPVADTMQDPPSYLDSMVYHLNALVQADRTTPVLRKEIADSITALNNVRYWLAKVRQDAQQVLKMSDGQLAQPSGLTLLNDMVENTNRAYSGESDPATNAVRQGVTWLHEHLITLATIDVSTITDNGTHIQMIPDTKHRA